MTTAEALCVKLRACLFLTGSCVLLLWFILSIIVRLFSVPFYLLIFFRIAVLSSDVKELTSWLSAYAVLRYAVLIVCVPFPLDIWGRMCNAIVSVSDHCLLVYLA